MVQVYNYMMESNPYLRQVSYPAHKRSELKKIYGNIVNLSKDSPFYKISLSRENQEYTIGVKEASIALKAKLNSLFDSENSAFATKTISNSNENVLSASLLNDDTEGLPESIIFKVRSLASVQINRGKELLQSSRALIPGEYLFRAEVLDEVYHLSFDHPHRKENRESIRDLADYLNQSVPGIHASVEKGTTEDYSRIVITSDQASKDGEPVFTFEDEDLFHVGIVDFFGLNRTDQQAAPAKFELNGIEKQTASNIFHLENKMKIALHNTSEEEPVMLSIVSDSDKILLEVDSFLSSFNQLIRLAKDRTAESKEHNGASKLMNEIHSLENVYQDELEACGLIADDDGMLSVNDSLAVQAAKDGGIESLFTRENGFIARLKEKAEAITINPMEYLDKIIVTYPNSENKTYRNPYVTSMYSGLFFSSYC